MGRLRFEGALGPQDGAGKGTARAKDRGNRWGEEDEVGALNEITPSVILSALKLVKKGRVLSLAQTYQVEIPTVPFHGPFFYSTFRTVQGCLDMFKDYPNRLGSTICRYELSDHTGTHVDSLNHASEGFELYNGVDARKVLTDSGTTRLGIETMPPVVARGILLDFPGYIGVDMLEPEHEITPAETKAVAKAANLRFMPGDVVLFYTGYCKLWMKDNAKYLNFPPGPGTSTARWLARRRVGMTGSDTSSFDVVKRQAKLLFPCHQILIKQNGVHIVENLRLDQLARTGVREFLFVCLPLKLKGGAGSPVAPIAVY